MHTLSTQYDDSYLTPLPQLNRPFYSYSRYSLLVSFIKNVCVYETIAKWFRPNLFHVYLATKVVIADEKISVKQR